MGTGSWSPVSKRKFLHAVVAMPGTGRERTKQAAELVSVGQWQLDAGKPLRAAAAAKQASFAVVLLSFTTSLIHAREMSTRLLFTMAVDAISRALRSLVSDRLFSCSKPLVMEKALPGQLCCRVFLTPSCSSLPASLQAGSRRLSRCCARHLLCSQATGGVLGVDTAKCSWFSRIEV